MRTLDGFDLDLYIEHNGCSCPVCGSEDLDWDSPTWTTSGTEGVVSCNNCGATWVEAHKISSVMILDASSDIVSVEEALEMREYTDDHA